MERRNEAQKERYIWTDSKKRRREEGRRGKNERKKDVTKERTQEAESEGNNVLEVDKIADRVCRFVACR
jgi:hypothetical protein